MADIVLPIKIEIVEKGEKPAAQRRRSEQRQRQEQRQGTSGESNQVSQIGVYHPRLHYKQRRRKYVLPETGSAPLAAPEIADESQGRIPSFRSAYVRPTGVQQERRARQQQSPYRDKRSRAPVQHETFAEKDRREKKELREELRRLKELQESMVGPLGQASKAARTVGELAQNPVGFVGGNVLKVLGGAGPYGAAAVAAITAIVGLPIVAETLIKVLGQKGGIVNYDWHRRFEEELNGFLTLEEQKRRIFGEDYFVVAARGGFTRVDDTDVVNSLYDRDSDRYARIGQSTKARGLA